MDYKVKIICTANYAPKTHWSYPFYNKKVNPETKNPHNLDCGFLKFTTDDNKSIDAEQYLATIKSAGNRQSRLAYAGNDWFDQVEGALWTVNDIQRSEPLKLNEYIETTISFDPAVTNSENSDGHGVCIAGKTKEDYYIIDCFEEKDDVNNIAKKICQLYHTYDCSKLVVEVNNGGDFIPSLISKIDPTVYTETVRATKGKLTRAEPICALYKVNICCFVT